MPAIDLHCHSHFSDGSLSPSDLVAMAAKNGVEVLALTDHDSVEGIPEAQQAALQHGIQLIHGVEISAAWAPYNIHVVGLNVDIHHPLLVSGLSAQATARARRAQAIAERLEKLGMGGAYEGALALAKSPEAISRTHFGQWLFESKHVTTVQQGFDRFLSSGKPACVPMPWASLEDTVQWIRAAGGVAVLAHPGRYRMTRSKMRLLIQAFKQAGGQAIEVATATEQPEMIRYLGQLASQYGLAASQGSDYHGKPTPWITLGRFPALPKECQPVWQLWQAA